MCYDTLTLIVGNICMYIIRKLPETWVTSKATCTHSHSYSHGSLLCGSGRMRQVSVFFCKVHILWCMGSIYEYIAVCLRSPTAFSGAFPGSEAYYTHTDGQPHQTLIVPGTRSQEQARPGRRTSQMAVGWCPQGTRKPRHMLKSNKHYWSLTMCMIHGV